MKAQASFATALRDGRQRAGLTQSALAERAGLRQPDVAGFESNRRPCGRDVAERLADALRIAGEARRKFVDAAVGTTVSGREAAFRATLERVLRSEVIGIDLEVPIGGKERADMVATTTVGRRWVVEWKIIGELKDGKFVKFSRGVGNKTTKPK